MNIMKFWQDQVEVWNDEQKCGFCWAFGGALTESGINTYRIRQGQECCVHLFVTHVQLITNNEYNESGMIFDPECNYNFVLWALIPSRLDINNHNEIPEHEESEGVTFRVKYHPRFIVFIVGD